MSNTGLPIPPAQVALQVAPMSSQHGGVISEDIRHFIWDRTIADNPLDLDLTFSDPEIAAATRYAVMMYNAAQPYITTHTVDNINGDYLWLVSIAYHLYLGKLQVLNRSDIDYTAGGMSVDLIKRRAEHYQTWVGVFKTEADRLIGEQKLARNVNSFFACY